MSQLAAKLESVPTVRVRDASGRRARAVAFVEPVQDLGQRGGVALAGRGQGDALAREPTKEQLSEPSLESLDLLANRARRDGEFVRGLLEGEVARGGLEGAQRRQGRKAATGHRQRVFVAKVSLGKGTRVLVCPTVLRSASWHPTSGTARRPAWPP